MGERVRRKVVAYEKSEIYRGYSGSTRQKETLECGHVVYNKGSVGKAEFRYCHDCYEFKNGAKKYDDGALTFWNPEANTLVSVPYRVGLVPKIDEKLASGFQGSITVYVRG